MKKSSYVLFAVIMLALTALACSGAGGSVEGETPTATATTEVLVVTATPDAVETGAESETDEGEGGEEVAQGNDDAADNENQPSAETTDDVKEPCEYDAAFMADITIPDGTVMQPYDVFDKTWQLQNTGDCAWPEGVSAAYVSGDTINGPASVYAPAAQPNENVNVTAQFMAPEAPGTYTAVYQLKTDDGVYFGGKFTVTIEVKDDDQPTPTLVLQIATPKPTATIGGVLAPPTCDYAASIIEHTRTKNGSILNPGQYFEKGWKFYNGGNCDWPTGSQMVFLNGSQMGAPSKKILQSPLKKGEQGEIYLTFYAPQQPGQYVGYFQIQTGDGTPISPKVTVEITVQ